MNATRYFVEQVLRKRPEISPDMCRLVIAAPIRRLVQQDGRIRFWGEVSRAGETSPRYLRVVTLADGDDPPQRLLRSRISAGRIMKLHYCPDTDSLYIEFTTAPSSETREVSDGVNLDLDASGAIVGLDIDQASNRLDLSTLETREMPFRTTKAA